MDTGTSEANNELGALSQQITAVVERVSPSIVAIDARPRVRTSGVIWRPGILVSTNHTIKRDEEITVTLHGGQQVGATVVGRDGGTDLAVLRLENTTEAMASAQFADAATLRVGNLVLAVAFLNDEHTIVDVTDLVGPHPKAGTAVPGEFPEHSLAAKTIVNKIGSPDIGHANLHQTVFVVVKE